MTGCDQRCATDPDESGQDSPTDDCAENVPVYYKRDRGYRSLVEDLNQRDGIQTKYTQPSVFHSCPGHIRQARLREIERRNTLDISPSGENVDRNGSVSFYQGTVESHFTVGIESAEASLPQQLQSYVVSGQKAPAATSTLPGTSEVTGETCQLARQEQDEDVDPGTTTDTERQTDTDPNQPRHESPEEYQAYIKEVRRAGRQNFAKQTADLVRRTLQVGNWEDIVRQIPLANQFLSETIETAKSEAMTIYDKHVQDKGSPQRLYKLQEALVKRAVLSLSKKCKG
ncbi:hypothetical protein Bbelb_338220 [Branchiostoma belcheri]|nr:hypothetical protein Bbelb_338220 [Branchiostoma belcheri]